MARTRTIRRDAVRAVTTRDGLILMMSVPSLGAYKFPGGGVLPHETDTDALDRELLEETGRHLTLLGPLLHTDLSQRPDRDDSSATFAHTSRYYRATVSEPVTDPCLDASELAAGMAPVWVSWSTAVIGNKIALGRAGADEYIARDLRALKHLAAECQN